MAGRSKDWAGLLCCGLLWLSSVAQADMNDEPLLYSVNVHEAEWRKESGENAFAWDIVAWAGTTRDRFVARTEGESGEKETEDFETLLLYSRAVSPYWNVNAGWRGDWQPAAERNWATVELEGTAPGFIETRASLLAASRGRFGARLKLETEWYLTQHWELRPRVETDWYNKNDLANGRASGFSGIELGLRLAYLIRPNLSPYVGVDWSRKLGDTRDIKRAASEDPDSRQVLVGLSFWF